MSFKIGKYKFESEDAFNTKRNALQDADKHTFVKLGAITIEEAEVDSDGNITKDELFSDDFHVDVFWIDLNSHPSGWDTNAVVIADEGVHSFYGVSYQKNKI